MTLGKAWETHLQSENRHRQFIGAFEGLRVKTSHHTYEELFSLVSEHCQQFQPTDKCVLNSKVWQKNIAGFKSPTAWINDTKVWTVCSLIIMKPNTLQADSETSKAVGTDLEPASAKEHACRDCQSADEFQN